MLRFQISPIAASRERFDWRLAGGGIIAVGEAADTVKKTSQHARKRIGPAAGFGNGGRQQIDRRLSAKSGHWRSQSHRLEAAIPDVR
jgi:hypothetical protein